MAHKKLILKVQSVCCVGAFSGNISFDHWSCGCAMYCRHSWADFFSHSTSLAPKKCGGRLQPRTIVHDESSKRVSASACEAEGWVGCGV